MPGSVVPLAMFNCLFHLQIIVCNVTWVQESLPPVPAKYEFEIKNEKCFAVQCAVHIPECDFVFDQNELVEHCRKSKCLVFSASRRLIPATSASPYLNTRDIKSSKKK